MNSMTLNTMQRVHSVCHRTVDPTLRQNIIAGTLLIFWTQEIDDRVIIVKSPLHAVTGSYWTQCGIDGKCETLTCSGSISGS